MLDNFSYLQTKRKTAKQIRLSSSTKCLYAKQISNKQQLYLISTTPWRLLYDNQGKLVTSTKTKTFAEKNEKLLRVFSGYKTTIKMKVRKNTLLFLYLCYISYL